MRTHNVFGTTFCGTPTLQYWADLQLWEMFLNEHPGINTIVELGTWYGGMMMFLAVQASARKMVFYSFDKVLPMALKRRLATELELEHKFILGDFWEDSNWKLLNILRERLYKPVLLFVDGGDKAKEFAAFVPELSVGDYVAVHDYSTEFLPEHVEPVEHLVTPAFLAECLSPPQPCLTRFWRRT